MKNMTCLCQPVIYLKINTYQVSYNDNSDQYKNPNIPIQNFDHVFTIFVFHRSKVIRYTKYKSKTMVFIFTIVNCLFMKEVILRYKIKCIFNHYDDEFLSLSTI